MKQKILLVEPNYKNKYPPIGLMKLSTYHKLLGDDVSFFKGNVKRIINEQKAKQCLKSLKRKLPEVPWNEFNHYIYDFFKKRRFDKFDKLPINSEQRVKFNKTVRFYSNEYIINPLYDRIYITTLFTFYWNITIKTINECKPLVKNLSNLYVGGVMASLLSKEIEDETGITPFKGLLDKQSMLGDRNKHIIDELPLDYSILDEIEYKYPTNSAYFTFMTKGCTRKCTFCSVPKLEPTYKPKIESIKKFEEVNNKYGVQRNLLLMDNNVLASPNFPEIIEEIKNMGFAKGAKFKLPNPIDVSFKCLSNSINDKVYIKKTHKLLVEFYDSLDIKSKLIYKEIIEKFSLNCDKDLTKSNIISAYKALQPIISKKWGSRIVNRYVDFNQGIDGRYMNEENVKLLSQINLRPLRIAFDYIGMKEKYINAVELAAKNGFRFLSNYILYNFNDKPEDLYNRLKINIDLNKKFNLEIFSFPMKYVPLFGEESKDRKYIGPKWNKKFLRAINCILNATKGIVAPGNSFFNVAFGKSIQEFNEILYMPETFILYRNKFKKSGLLAEWRKTFRKLTADDKEEAKRIIEKSDFKNINDLSNNTKILKLLSFYTINEKDLEGMDMEMEQLKDRFKKLAKENIFVNLTLTQDFS